MGLDPLEMPVTAAEIAAPAAIEAGEDAKKPRQGNQPLCPLHHSQMRAYATGSVFTYYRCEEKGCKQTDKKLRPVGPVKNLYGHGKSARCDR